MQLGRAKDLINPVFDNEWPGGVMNGDKVDIGTDPCKSILNRVGSFRPAGDDLDIHKRQVRSVLFLEPLKIFRRDDNDRLRDVLAVDELFGSSDPYRSPFELHKHLFALLREATAL